MRDDVWFGQGATTGTSERWHGTFVVGVVRVASSADACETDGGGSGTSVDASSKLGIKWRKRTGFVGVGGVVVDGLVGSLMGGTDSCSS
eukprot:CAMPEP_0198255774 /NCGR_PEP_ID=MMETSP1447-20131203/5837_1 /TAXON_ID=420782 /ORGANISM="Chaetoceros dichaeta, Strain CCMP1751" /LENGTH=88 /DNA_ID=CAMNT_0043942231 /DNA_START=268 /DNA_END=531 /DNA_ORIENTATION=+